VARISSAIPKHGFLGMNCPGPSRPLSVSLSSLLGVPRLGGIPLRSL
jgi:hypothetical protein